MGFNYVILNGLFFWELRQIMRIEAWKEQYAAELPGWLDAIGQMDALNSLATFVHVTAKLQRSYDAAR